MTIKELTETLKQWPEDTEVEIMIVEDRNITREIWDVGRYDITKPEVIYIHG